MTGPTGAMIARQYIPPHMNIVALDIVPADVSEKPGVFSCLEPSHRFDWRFRGMLTDRLF